ncbi:MAG: enoyl-CoA hydratase/isomerase family protein [Acidimicrobiales bacterium]|jgi:enoyl-CoA hydratase/carnithine racemase|nr:enoyl-CoA hydratase/isomerase family protein [Acidimicrobiales bacterium]
MSTDPNSYDPSKLATITVEMDGHVAWVTLNRPDAYNAFTPTMEREISETWQAFRRDDNVRAIVLTAAGEKSFCVGIDRNESEFTALDDSAGLYGTSNNFMYDDPGEKLGPKSQDLWKPVICAVNGMAVGGAFYLLAEADVIIAADNATFFDPHVTYGMAAVYEPMKMLQRMPLGEILRLSLLGNYERMSAETAHRIGLVSEVCPGEELVERAKWIADAIAAQPPVAVQGTMRAIWAANDMGRLNAIAMAPSILTTGTDVAALAAGADSFSEGARIEPRTR